MGKPILFVHGFTDVHWTPWWSVFERKLKNKGFCDDNKCQNVNLGNIPGTTVGSPEDYAQKVKKKVLEFYEKYDNEVTLIGHSMGGLNSRYVVDLLDGHKYVDNLITVGTPHQGTLVANLGRFTPGGSDMLRNCELICDKLCEDNLKNNVNYYTIYSEKDLLVIPRRNAMINSNKNNVYNYKIDHKGHIRMIIDDEVINKIVEFIEE